MLTQSLATGLSLTKMNGFISIENRWFDPDVVRRAVFEALGRGLRSLCGSAGLRGLSSIRW